MIENLGHPLAMDEEPIQRRQQSRAPVERLPEASQASGWVLTSRSQWWAMMDRYASWLVVSLMHEFDEYRRQRTVLLTTRRRDGTTVGTAVHVALGPDGRAYFRTWSSSGKAKRMRNFSQVWIAPCTTRGNATGIQQQATARPLTGTDAVAAARALAAKYRVLQGILVPAFHQLTNKTTVHYELLPPDAA